MKKSILFDGTCIGPMKTGVGKYALSLLESLQAYREEVDFHLLARLGQMETRLAESTRFVGVNSNRIRKMAPWDCFGLGSRYSLLHEPNFVPQRFSGPVIVTVHDLTVFLFPGLHPVRRVCWAHLFKKRMAAADHILTVSNHSKQDIVNYLGVPSEKVTVTYLGSSPHQIREHGPEEEEIFLAGLKLRRPFLLSVGTLEPRKNISRLLEAYAVFCRQGVGREATLVLVGQKGWMTDRIFQKIAEYGISDRVIVTGYLREGELSMLYSRATAFVYPSLYEGFGLPPLEAMAHGAPVIVSDSSSLPEVVGDAGIRIDPQSTGDLVEALRLVFSSGSLREQMKIKGKARAAEFSWERCAAQTMEVYRRVMG